MDRRLGVLAFGDSITNGGGELQWGVALQSWALWTARGLGMPYTGCARDGATAHDVVGPADPRVRRHRGRSGGRATTSASSTSASTTCAAPAGTRRPYERDLRRRGPVPAAALHAGARVHAPARPRAPAGERRSGSRRRTRRSSGSRACSCCDLRDFGARNRVMVDAVHPTAFGQVAIAERALAVLAARRAADARAPVDAHPLGDDAVEAAARRRDLRLPPGQAGGADRVLARRRAARVSAALTERV